MRDRLACGTSINKKCVYVGHMNIKGIVACKTQNATDNFNMLQNTSLNLVMNLADVVSNGIYSVINYDCDV